MLNKRIGRALIVKGVRVKRNVVIRVFVIRYSGIIVWAASGVRPLFDVIPSLSF